MSLVPFQADGKIIGITGSIGAGKGLVTSYLSHQGYAVIDFDQVSKEIRALPNVRKELIKVFGTDDSKAIRKLVGMYPDRAVVLSKLVAVPALMEAMKRTNQFFKDGHKAVFWEAALLIETKTFKTMHGIILVSAEQDTRIARVKERDQVGEEYIKPMIKQQYSETEKVNLLKSEGPSHIILENNGTKEEFQTKLSVLEPWISSLLPKPVDN
jgi:dephospho-CoA kinase